MRRPNIYIQLQLVIFRFKMDIETLPEAHIEDFEEKYDIRSIELSKEILILRYSL